MLALLVAAQLAAVDDVERGTELLRQYECDRCHTGAVVDVSAVFGAGLIDNRDRSCVDCHRAIIAGDVNASAALIARWQGSIVHLREAPRIDDAAGRLKPEWIADFLVKPRHLRRGLGESMPRMPIKPQDAAAMAAALTNRQQPPDDLRLQGARRGDAGRGLVLLEKKGCAMCHAFSGVDVVARALPMTVDGAVLVRGMSLAPDLRETRKRTTAEWAAGWLLQKEPSTTAPPSSRAMPYFDLSPVEVNDLVAAIFDAELKPVPKREAPARLPVLERKVRFAEVQERVFSKTCIHCHAEDSKNLGVGGPGNNGGFGYQGTGLVLTSYERVQAGSIDVAKGAQQHKSVFRKVADGTPLLVAQLRARQLEEAGEEVDGVVGMPLGLPAISAEDLQLVETWVAQGRPQ